MKKIFPSFLVLMLALFVDSSLNAMQFDGEFCLSWTASGKVTNAHRVHKVFIPPCTHSSHVTAAEETVFLTLKKAGLR